MPPLPAPCPQYGHYTLADGSRVYPSGSPDYPVCPGKWMAWLRGGDLLNVLGRPSPDGEFLLDKRGPCYFA